MIRATPEDKTFVRNLPPLEVYRRVVLGIIMTSAPNAKEAVFEVEEKLRDPCIPIDEIVGMFHDKDSGRAFSKTDSEDARFIAETIKRGLTFRRQQLITDAQRQAKARWN